MSGGLPITLTGLETKLCIVVGGGAVAERKVESLLDASARVRVIAPAATDALAALARGGKIEWLPSAYRDGDLEGAFLVIAATDDAPVNRAVAQEATARGILVNVVDDPAWCNFTAPAVVRRGDLTIAISTGGDVPALAGHLRGELERQFGDEWDAYVEWLARLRGRIAARYPELEARRQAWARVLDSDLRIYVATRGDQEIEARIAELLG